MHPDQVHRVVGFENVTVSAWAIDNEYLNPEYLKLLEDITPAKPLALESDAFSLIAEAVSLCIRFTERKTVPLYQSLLRDSCNAVIALVLSLFMEQSKGSDSSTRFEVITKAFKKLLEHHYTQAKRPADYARRLNISISYLNECVKNATGFPVSYHIQQRVVLEAKRLLYHTNGSFKEIAGALGYDDYSYFSRLFTKVAGKSPSTFRAKNRD